MSIYWFVLPIVLYNVVLYIYQTVSVKSALKKEVKVNLQAVAVRGYTRLAKLFSLLGALFTITVLNILVRGDMSLSGVLGYNGIGFVLYEGFIFHYFRVISVYKSWKEGKKEIKQVQEEAKEN